MLATFNGKIVPGTQTEFFGSYLQHHPARVRGLDRRPGAVPVRDGRAGRMGPDDERDAAGRVRARMNRRWRPRVADATTAVQFTMTDVGSEWTETTVNHSIVHNGETSSATDDDPDDRQEGHDGPERQPQGDARQLGDHARCPDQRQGQSPQEAAHASRQPPRPSMATVVLAADGLNVSYAPAAGYSGVDTFTYTIDGRHRRHLDGDGDGHRAFDAGGLGPQRHGGRRQRRNVAGDVQRGALEPEPGDGHRELPDGRRHRDRPAPTTRRRPGRSPSRRWSPACRSPCRSRGDTLAESNEKFSVRVTNPTNATIAGVRGRRHHHHRRRPTRDFDRRHRVDHGRQRRLRQRRRRGHAVADPLRDRSGSITPPPTAARLPGATTSSRPGRCSSTRAR